jgi:hypothetical protein
MWPRALRRILEVAMGDAVRQIADALISHRAVSVPTLAERTAFYNQATSYPFGWHFDG